MTLLIPVIEFAPTSYGARERAMPSLPSSEDPEGWFQYWSDSLADAGISGLRPWKPGSWLEPIEQLCAPGLLQTMIVDAYPSIVDLDLKYFGALSGGYILSQEGAELLPQCCGTLSDLEEWRDAAAHSSENLELVWIGHPWTFVRSSGGFLHFTELSDQQNPTEIRELLSVSSNDLLAAIDSASKEIDKLARRLLKTIEDLNPQESASSIVEILVRGRKAAD